MPPTAKWAWPFYGVNDTQDVTWTGGMFFDSISESLKERIDDNQGYRVSGRLTWLPYYDEPSNGRYLVHTGRGRSVHERPGRPRSRFGRGRKFTKGRS